jgi:hypothetical protein
MCSVHPGLTTLERVDGFTKEELATLAAGHETRRPAGHAKCARGAERACKLELLSY